MDLTFVCPECGKEEIGDSQWKRWCPHEVISAIDDLGVVVARRTVEMEPRESVNA